MELSEYWESIPIGRKNKAGYNDLMDIWGMSKRKVRYVLHELSKQDNGDGFVLIRSTADGGFWRTDDLEEIERYKSETVSRAVNTFAPLRKINRILSQDHDQMVIPLHGGE